MYPLDIEIKNRFWIYINTHFFPNIVSQILLVLLFYLYKGVHESGIGCVLFQFSKFFQVCDPLFANFTADQISQLPVTLTEPSTGGNSVCFVCKALRVDLIKITDRKSTRLNSSHMAMS